MVSHLLRSAVVLANGIMDALIAHRHAREAGEEIVQLTAKWISLLRLLRG